jgi:CBS-domain-containing membrane protein
MLVRDVMTPEAITIDAKDSVAMALHRMLDRKISGLPVLDAEGRLAGIITEGDFLRRAETGTLRQRPRWLELLVSPGRLAAEYSHSHGGTVDEVMTPAVITIEADAPLPEAVELMLRHRVKRLPVLEHRHLVGVLSRADLLRACLATPWPDPDAPRDDAAVAAGIDREIEHQAWCPLENVRVEVRDGRAELVGVVTDERTRDALRVLVENTAGVKQVVDHLTIIEPMTGMIVRTPQEP